MSQENVELVRRTFDAVRQGDLGGAVRGFRDDAVWHNTAEFPGPTSCVGPSAIVGFWASLMEAFEESANGMVVEQLVEGEDSVVLAVHSVGRAKASGVPIDVRWGAAFHVRDGKISRVDIHGDWAKALEAGGLGE
jgi:ketosteroid isomerase-like protein